LKQGTLAEGVALCSDTHTHTNTHTHTHTHTQVSVDDFKQGTLAEAIELVEQEVYKTEAGAVHLIERIWVRHNPKLSPVP
jgi:hypothetical protein